MSVGGTAGSAASKCKSLQQSEIENGGAGARGFEPAGGLV
jgi:hypothetical protein